MLIPRYCIDSEILGLAKIGMKVSNGFSVLQLALNVWRAQFCLYRSQRCHSLPQTSMARKGETFTSSWLEQPAVQQERALEQKASCSTQKEHNPNIYQHPEACMMNLVSNNGLNVTFRFFKEWGASQQLFQLSSPLGCVCVRGEIL